MKEGVVVAAETQSSGRGRIGREWVSPKGGLWFSILLRPTMQLVNAAMLTLVGSVAVAGTIGKLYGMKTEIKWPNDVLINKKKLCGILAEGEIRGKALHYAVLGFGVNANVNLEALPKHLRESATTLKEQLGRDTSREILLCRLLENAEAYYSLLNNGEFEAILNDWRKLSGFLGSYVEIVNNRERIEGWAIDLDNHGALIVRLKDQATRRITSGDVIRIVK